MILTAAATEAGRPGQADVGMGGQILQICEPVQLFGDGPAYRPGSVIPVTSNGASAR